MIFSVCRKSFLVFSPLILITTKFIVNMSEARKLPQSKMSTGKRNDDLVMEVCKNFTFVDPFQYFQSFT